MRIDANKQRFLAKTANIHMRINVNKHWFTAKTGFIHMRIDVNKQRFSAKSQFFCKNFKKIPIFLNFFPEIPPNIAVPVLFPPRTGPGGAARLPGRAPGGPT